MNDYNQDSRIVMTLDAGGTNFRFSAIQGNQSIIHNLWVPSDGNNLERCLSNIVEAFAYIKSKCPEPPVAISFAFPGPADYPNGIIGDQKNLPGFRGGVALGPMLEEIFKIPVYINNDCDLFTYGEAIAGFLPHVNDLLKQGGSPKRYKNLFGITLGTGFGGGIVHDGNLFLGDNSIAGEIWAFRNKLQSRLSAEEGASIRAVRKIYAQVAGISILEAPEPEIIQQIAFGEAKGDQEAATEAYRRLGEIAGDALSQALTLIDGLAVIGGGLSKAHKLFMPALMDELNCIYQGSGGNQWRRLASAAFNLEDPEQLQKFIKGECREISVPRSQRKVNYDPLQRIGIGVTRLGTSEAVAIGAYIFALQKLDNEKLRNLVSNYANAPASKIEPRSSVNI